MEREAPLKVFGERLGHAMRLRRLNASDLARQTGISKSTISRYLTGESDASATNLLRISEALRISVQWLLGQPLPDQTQLLEETVALMQQKLRSRVPDKGAGERRTSPAHPPSATRTGRETS